MKKIMFSFILVLSIFLFSERAHAACANGVTVGDESLCLLSNSSKNIAGTAYVESGKLVLNNYNGGSISFYANGSNNFVDVTLIGENHITNEKGYGIKSFIGGINFAGNGSLTITSKVPLISYDVNTYPQQPDADYSTYNVTELKILGTEYAENKEEVVEDNKVVNDTPTLESTTTTGTQNTVNLDTNLVYGVVIGVVLLFVIVIFLLIMQNNKIKKINKNN